MPTLKKRTRRQERLLLSLPVAEIHPNPVQPRRYFSQESLEELAESIARHGILQPLTVRRRSGGYELVSGERRLRAAKLAGLEVVPCLVAEVNMEESGVLALVENLQRRDLSFVEEAEGISRLVKMFGLSQEEAARRLGKSQSAVANKLRLLRLPSDVLETLGAQGLTERHGRALLRLETAQAQREALGRMVELGMNVAAAECYVDALLARAAGETALAAETPPPLLAPPAPARTGPRRSFVMKDLRLFMNTLTRSLELMRSGGVDADMDRRETEEAIVLTISIPKNRQTR